MGSNSLNKAIEKTTEEMFEEYCKNVVEPAVKKALTEIIEEYHLEFSKLYDEIIRQFYLYETTQYYRHNEGRGTGKGHNLYEAFLNEIVYSGDFVSEYMIRIDSDFMESTNYKTTADKVLDFILDGYRGPKPDPQKAKLEQITFNILNGSFEAEVVFNGVELKGTPRAVLEEAVDMFIPYSKARVRTTLGKYLQK